MLKFLLKLPVLKRLVPSILKKFSFKEISYKYDDIHFNLDLRYLVDRRFFLYGYDAKNIEILNKYIQNYLSLLIVFRLFLIIKMASSISVFFDSFLKTLTLFDISYGDTFTFTY